MVNWATHFNNTLRDLPTVFFCLCLWFTFQNSMVASFEVFANGGREAVNKAVDILHSEHTSIFLSANLKESHSLKAPFWGNLYMPLLWCGLLQP